MEKITVETLKEQKGKVILVAVLLAACVWVFWPSSDPKPPAPPQGPQAQQPQQQQPQQQANKPGGNNRPGQPAAVPEPPPPRKISTGSS